MAEVTFEKLNDDNYGYWSQKMKYFLIWEGLWSVVDDEAVAAYQAENGKKALAFICLHIEDNQLMHTEGAVNGRAAWIALRQYHQRNTVGQKIHLLSKLFRLQMNNGASMQEHLTKMTQLMSQLNAIGAGLEESIAVCVIMRSVCDEYQTLVASMEAWDDERLTLSNVKAKLMEEWERLKDRQEVEAQGVGTVNLKILIDDGKPMNVSINNVLYVPELDENLVSVFKLTKAGFSILFQDDKCFLMKGDDKVLVSEYFDGLYRIKVEGKEHTKT